MMRREFSTASVAAKWVLDVETDDGRLLSGESTTFLATSVVVKLVPRFQDVVWLNWKPN